MDCGEEPIQIVEGSVVISASRFARIHSSTWKSLTPTTDLYSKRVNGLARRIFPPLTSDTAPKRRALINEIGFELFSAASRTGERRTWHNTSSLEDASMRAAERIRQFSGREAGEFSGPTNNERTECIELASRLLEYFKTASNGEVITVHPKFHGCGIVDACAGDVYFDGALYEIKAGDRGFLSTDLRQLLLYAALNKASEGKIIDRIGLVNPRIGVSFVAQIRDACLEVSGRPPEDLLTEIIRVISSGDTSR